MEVYGKFIPVIFVQALLGPKPHEPTTVLQHTGDHSGRKALVLIDLAKVFHVELPVGSMEQHENDKDA